LEQTGSVPYALIFKKGNGKLAENISLSIDEQASADYGFTRFLSDGSFDSPVIGPADKWENLYYDIKNELNPLNDSISVSIYGLDENMSNDMLLVEKVGEMDFALTEISSEEFPYLKLRFFCQDDIDRTMAQLDYWRITYQGIPELAVNPNKEFAMPLKILAIMLLIVYCCIIRL
jgi:hypothetical protein